MNLSKTIPYCNRRLGTGSSFGGSDSISRGSSYHDGGGGGGGGGSGKGHHHHGRRRPSSDAAPSAGPRLNRKVFIPSPPRCSTPGAAGSGGGGGLDDADEELDDDLDDVMGDEDMDEDDVMQRPPFQHQLQPHLNHPPIDILHVSPGGQDAVLMINPGSDEVGGGAMRINLGDASLMAATNRRGALRATLRGLRGAVGSGRLGAAASRTGVRGNNNGSSDASNNAELRSSGGSAGRGVVRSIAATGARSLVSASGFRGGGGGAAVQSSSSGRGGGTGRAQRSSGSASSSSAAVRANNAVDFLSVEDLEIDEAEMIPPEDEDDEDDEDDDDDDDDEDEEDDDDDDDDEDDDDEDEMVDVIEASSAGGGGAGGSRNNRGLELEEEEDEEFSSASSRPGSSDNRSGIPPPPRAIHIPGVVENAIFGGIVGAGRNDEAIVDQVEAMGGSGVPSGQVGNVLIAAGSENEPPPHQRREAGVDSGPASALEALLGGRAAAAAAAQLLSGPPPPHPGGVVGFPPILDIPPDADDEAMVELAIALSLQDQGAGGGGGVGSGAGGAPIDPPPPLNLLQNLQAFAELNSHMEEDEGVDDRAVTPPPPPPSSGLESTASSSVGGAGGLSVAAVVQHGGGSAAGRFSDTTTSAPGSDDDEGSTAATEGSTLRTSPVADRDGAGGGSGRGASEEGSADGSVSDEDVAVSAGDPSRSGSSAGGEVATPSRDGGEKGGSGASSSLARGTTTSASIGGVPKTAGGGAPPPPPPAFGVAQKQLHRLRLLLLEGLLQYMQHLKEGGGVRSIPYMQVLLMLTSDLDGSSDQDRQAMDALLKTLMKHLRDFATTPTAEAAEATSSEGDSDASRMSIVDRNSASEVDLIVMRFYSVLMSRTSSSSKSGGKSSDAANVSNSFASNATARSLLTSNAINFCLKTLQQLLPYWKALEITAAETPASSDAASGAENSGSASGNAPAAAAAAPAASSNATTAAGATASAATPGALIKPHPLAPPPDMSPFFLRQYVKGHANDIFKDYPQLLTEMVLRLPLQIKKLTDGSSASKSNKAVATAEVIVTAPTIGVTAEEKDVASAVMTGLKLEDAASAALQEVVKSKVDESAEKTAPTPFDQDGWFRVLCEYMMTQETPFVRRQVRKLLLFICGTKTKVRPMYTR